MSASNVANSWVLLPKLDGSVQQPKLRLFCFPQAGSGAWVYQEWQSVAPDGVQIVPVEFPGRNTRLREPQLNSMAQLVAAALDGLGPLLRSGVPFSFFGHSMGSWVAYAAIQELQARGWDVPVKLYISATRAPQLAGPQHDTDGIQMHRLEANEFWHVFERRYGHNPDLDDVHVRKFVLPILRADFQIVETYRRTSTIPLPCPLTVCGGLGDPRTDKSKLEAWKECAADGKIGIRWFHGGHNYLFKEGESKREFLKFLVDDLRHLLAQVPAAVSVSDVRQENSTRAQVHGERHRMSEDGVKPSVAVFGDGASTPHSENSHSFSEAGATVASSASYALSMGANRERNAPKGEGMTRSAVVHSDSEGGELPSPVWEVPQPRKGCFQCFFFREVLRCRATI